jgi:hypothetical protein
LIAGKSTASGVGGSAEILSALPRYFSFFRDKSLPTDQTGILLVINASPMKTSAILLFVLLATCQAKSQNILGADNNPRLNESEGHLLDSLLQAQRHDFEFTNKRVSFIYGGSTGNAFQPKSEFFSKNVLPWTTKGETPGLQLLILTDSEKIRSGGYDALVVAWAKILFTQHRKDKMLRKLAAKRGV